MTLSRNKFFLLLFILVIGALTFNKILWLAHSKVTTGKFWFTGHGNLGSVLGMSTYPVIRFNTGTETISFNGNINLPSKPEEKISIRYQKNNPSDAKVNTFLSIWGDTLAYALGPVLVLLAFFFIPDIFPKNSRIRFGKRPFIYLLPE